jgi:hypothetical protein
MDFSRKPVVGWKYEEPFLSGQVKILVDMAYIVDSCKYENEKDQIKLFCDNKLYYLLFKKIS